MSNIIQWEQINADEYSKTHRAKVPGGWLIRTKCYHDDRSDIFDSLTTVSSSVAIIFYPDSDHSWAEITEDQYKNLTTQERELLLSLLKKLHKN